MTRAPGARRLVHGAVPYAGPDSFVAAAIELIERGTRNGEACLALAVGAKVDELRATLGPASRRVGFIDLSVRGRNPARVLPALRSFLEAHRGRRARIVAEPVYAELSAAGLAETLIAELVLSKSECHDWDAQMCCLYDTESLGAGAVDVVRSAHPDPSDRAATAAALAAAFTRDLPPAPADAEACKADMTTLGTLRDFVRRGAVTSGLDGERSEDLVYAVNEVVTNSICHGEGRAAVSMWTEQGITCCEVRDRGRFADVLVGRIAPRPGQASGRGLWLVNQLCDLVQVRSSYGGTVVRMIVDR